MVARTRASGEFKIFKYPVDMKDIVEIEMPQDSDILTFEQQGGDLFLWALVDTEDARLKQTKRFRLCGTGHDLICEGISEGASLHFVGSVFLNRNQLVFHLFEIKNG